MIHIEYTEEYLAATCASRIFHTKRNKKRTKLRAIYKTNTGLYKATLFTARGAEVRSKDIATRDTFQEWIHRLQHKKNWKDLVLD